MRKITAILAGALILSGCAKSKPVSPSPSAALETLFAETSTPLPSPTLPVEVLPSADGDTETIPDGYTDPVEKGGTIENISYQTVDTDGTTVITKNAEVYLPYGYENTEDHYSVLYFYHGYQGNSTTVFSTAGSALKNTFDHLIASEIIPAMIIVAPTYESTDQVVSWQRSSQELKSMPQELSSSLIPFIDASYRTIANRNHRIIGGFSMGGVTAWYAFAQDMKDFRYYMPLSGDCWAIAEYGGLYATDQTSQYLKEAVSNQGYDSDDFMVFTCVGTKEQFYQPITRMVESLRSISIFNEQNLFLRLQQGAGHDYTAMPEDLYNALPVLCYDMKYHSEN